MNEYEEREREIERELVWLEKTYPPTSDLLEPRESYCDKRREISDLKHELWQSRL